MGITDINLWEKINVSMNSMCRCDPGGDMKGAASGVQEIAGAMWGTHDVPPSIVLSEIELRERRGEERGVTWDQTLVTDTGGSNEGHLVTECRELKCINLSNYPLRRLPLFRTFETHVYCTYFKWQLISPSLDSMAIMHWTYTVQIFEILRGNEVKEWVGSRDNLLIILSDDIPFSSSRQKSLLVWM